MSLFGDRQITLDRIVRWVLSLLLIAGLILTLSYFSDVLLPFAIALVFAYLLAPLVRFVQRLVKRRVLAVATTLLLVLAIAAGLVMALIPLVADELRETGQLLETILSDLDLDRRASQYLPPGVWSRLRALLERSNLSEWLLTNDIWDLLDRISENVAPQFSAVVSGVVSIVFAVVVLLIILLYLIFLLKDFEKIQTGWPSLIPPYYRGRIQVMFRDFERAMSRYFRAQLFIVLIEMTLYSICYWLIGLPLGFLFGLFLGLLAFVPYLQSVGLVLPGFLLVMLHALHGGDFMHMLLLVLAVFGAVIALQEIYLVPTFQGKATGLNPAMILLSLSVWGKLLGVLGLIIALPVTYLLLAYYRQFIARQEERESDEDDLEEEEEQLSYS